MKSNLFTRLALCLFALIGSNTWAMSFYEADPKAVTTEEKLNHYLFYLANHGLTLYGQTKSLEHTLPVLTERAVVDGARTFLPELLGAQTPFQKQLTYWGIEGAREAVKYSAKMQAAAKQKNIKIKRSAYITDFLAKQFLPALAKTLVVDLMYRGVSTYANMVLLPLGLNTETLAASPFTLQGLMYQQVKESGRGLCSSLYDTLFSLQN